MIDVVEVDGDIPPLTRVGVVPAEKGDRALCEAAKVAAVAVAVAGERSPQSPSPRIDASADESGASVLVR